MRSHIFEYYGTLVTYMKKIDFEAHFYTQEYIAAMYHHKGYPRFADDDKTKDRRLWYNADVGQPFTDFLLNALLNRGKERLQKMDAYGVDMQVLSLSAPGLEQFDPTEGAALARSTNNALAEVIKKFPDRFMGYAALAPGNPDEAADELERCVQKLGFRGWNTHSNYGDTYLDNKKYLPIIERAEKLNVPIYVHPTVPDMPQLKGYGFPLAGAPFGFGLEAALCMMRLIYSGVFDNILISQSFSVTSVKGCRFS